MKIVSNKTDQALDQRKCYENRLPIEPTIFEFYMRERNSDINSTTRFRAETVVEQRLDCGLQNKKMRKNKTKYFSYFCQLGKTNFVQNGLIRFDRIN